MKLNLIFLLVLSPITLSAQNLIFNPGFDMTPWDTGWVITKGGDVSRPKASEDTTTYVSSPNCCFLLALGGRNASYSSISITQTIFPPVINCTCHVFLKYAVGSAYDPPGGAGISFSININNKWITELEEYNLGTDSTKNWIKWEKFYTITDTIKGISFDAGASSQVMNGAGGMALLFIDDVHISGTKIAVEESTFHPLIPNPGVSAFPNPFTSSTTIKLSTLNSQLPTFSIYDISGKLLNSINSTNSINSSNFITIGQNLQPGIYFLSVNKSKPIKIIKLK